MEAPSSNDAKPQAEFSICAVTSVVVLVLAFLSPFVLVPKNSEFTGAAAIVIVTLIVGGVSALILCISAFYRRERFAWISLLALVGALLLVASTTKL